MALGSGTLLGPYPTRSWSGSRESRCAKRSGKDRYPHGPRLSLPLGAVGPAVALFPDRYFLNKFQSRTYDIGRDGRFLMVAHADERAVTELTAVLNWLPPTP